ncbi:hypothetical protein CU098_010425 [Rhizopus stolonifer]|uniref:Uncharacterized protein n=1 Tax=Rhizopus stolonifer TaxID=4846 RepID=A0A367JT85_RHIST|nr:hypothetical protein CU098_010425 [Rhizopus stolonifer]
MQSTYGFQPDKVTFNTLLTACARKKDLKRAREILEWMWKDVEQHGSDSLLSPDHQTYTNLFWCYASYHPTPTTHRVSSVSDTTALSTEHHLLPIQVPHKRSQVVKEAQWLFQQLPSHVQRTSALLTAYLALHISQKQTAPCVDIYTHLFDKCHVQRDGFTFQHMLQLCYRTKDASLAWKVWEDYQDFLENREIQFDLKPNSVSEQKALDIKRHTLATSEGWTETQQQQLAILMANTLGRCDDVRNAIGILSTELRRLALNPPTLRDVMPIYNKCVQLENQEAKQELMYLCTKEQRRTNMKFKRINTTV